MLAVARQEPFQDYCNEDALNRGWLEKMDTSALHFKENTPKPLTAALDIGRLIHMCSLQTELFHDLAVVWSGGRTKPTKALPEGRPTWNKNSADYKDFKETQEAAGKIVMDAEDIVLCNKVREAVHGHKVAGELLREGDRELSIYWDHPIYGVRCKSLIDHMGATTCDLKSSRDIRPHKFNRSILEYGYDVQGAFYTDAVKALTGETRPYAIIAVEKSPPFDVVVYDLDDAILSLGRQKYTRWLERYLECMESGEWPGIEPDRIKAELPEYAYNEFDDGKVFLDGMEVAI